MSNLIYQNQPNTISIQITLYKAKILPTKNPPSSYTLSFAFDSEIFETDKVTTKEHDFNQKEIKFKTSHKISSIQSLIITSKIPSWMLFNSQLASISIPFNPLNFNSQKQWYHLKNEKEENIISILIALSTDYTDVSFSHRKTEMSYNEQIHSSIITSILNRTTILTHPNQNKHSSYDSGVREQKISLVGLDIGKSHVSEIIEDKMKYLNKYEEKLKMQQLSNNLAYNSIEDKEGILLKEKNKLNEKMKKYKIKQNEYQSNKRKQMKNAKRIQDCIARFELQKELYDFEQENFQSLNFIYLMSNDNSILQPRRKLNEDGDVSLSKNYVNSTIVSNSFMNQKSTKIVIENPSNYVIKSAHVQQRTNNPSKKSGSTNMTSNNSSGISFGEITSITCNNVNNTSSIKPPTTQIYLNSNSSSDNNNNLTTHNGTNSHININTKREGCDLLDSLESIPKNCHRRRTITNSHNGNVNYTNISPKNMTNHNLQTASCCPRKNSISQNKRRSSKCEKQPITKCKKKNKKQTVISLNSNKLNRPSNYHNTSKMSYSYYNNTQSNTNNSLSIGQSLNTISSIQHTTRNQIRHKTSK